MEIIFYREGPAHNSSSSHSLIFLDDKTYFNLNKRNLIGTDEESDYGWDTFTIADSNGKLNYFLCMLFSTYSYKYEWEEFNSDSDYKKARNTAFNTFFKYIRDTGIYNLYNPLISKEDLKNVLLNSSVDHNSHCTFPTYREVKKDRNKEFLLSFLKELIKPNYIILGGNDNSDNDHWLKDKASKNIPDLVLVYDKLKNDIGNCICEYDDYSNAYIVSFSDGSLMMLRF